MVVSHFLGKLAALIPIPKMHTIRSRGVFSAHARPRYEVVPKGAAPSGSGVDPLRYQSERKVQPAAGSDELMQVKLRYKAPNGQVSKLITGVVPDADTHFERASEDQRFSAAVAAYGMLLRGSAHKGTANWELVRRLAEDGRGRDEQGLRAEFIGLIARAAALVDGS